MDTAYAREYLTDGRSLQQKWCGVGWSDAELEKRITFVNSLSKLPKLLFKPLDVDRYEKTTIGDDGTQKTEIITNCKIENNDRLRCNTDHHQFQETKYPDLDNIYLRKVGDYLYIDIPMHKFMMQCARAREGPDAIHWTSLRYKTTK